MSRLIGVLGCLALVACGSSLTTAETARTVTTPPSTLVTIAPVGERSYQVVTVIDGDSLEAAIGGSNEELRLIGINSPEHDECHSNTSRAFLESLVEGERVVVEGDTTDRDRYDRLLRYIYLEDGSFINEILVESGMALARQIPPDTRHAEVLEEAETRAEDAGVGLWAPDGCGASSDTDIVITEINHDPVGNDTHDLNTEYIVIVNHGATVDMGGWAVRDESSSNRYTFPPGFSLDSGSSVTIHSGCGDQTTTNLYWCSNDAIWNNDGDTVFIQGPAGNIVTSRRY